MKLSDAGVLAIKQHEGLRLDAYQCEANRWTIGYGDTHGVRPGDRITMEEAERRLLLRISEFEQGVNRTIRRPMTQNQFDALVSLSYNIGNGAFASSDLAELFNANKIAAAAEQFGRFIFVRGEPVVVRRGDRGEHVIAWQRKLTAAGFQLLPDGDFGANTERATILWRQKQKPADVEEFPSELAAGVVYTKIISAVLVRRRFWEVVRFLTP